MKNMRALMIGRFQPFHNGHKYIIDQAFAEGKNVCIAIRDTELSEQIERALKYRCRLEKCGSKDCMKMAEETEEASEDNETPNKETASNKTLSLGEAVMKSVNQEIQAPADLKEEIAQEWEALYAERRGETDNSE